MEYNFKQYDKFLNAKLYLIEHTVTNALHSTSNYEEVLKDIRNICYDSYEGMVSRYNKFQKGE